MKRCRTLPIICILYLCALGLPPSDVWAQQTTTSTETIVVTGSRMPSYRLSSPTLSLGADEPLFQGKANLMDVMSSLPALVDSINSAQTVETIDIEGDAEGGSSLGVSTLNLRNLGTKRTLVLVDGRRHVGGRAGDTAVDINTIPMAMVERVEVLTGGASAVYGADAVTGVVNIITKRNFEGATFRVQGTTNNEGQANSFYGVIRNIVRPGHACQRGRRTAMFT